jgi:signal transduction histidine kinase
MKNTNFFTSIFICSHSWAQTSRSEDINHLFTQFDEAIKSDVDSAKIYLDSATTLYHHLPEKKAELSPLSRIGYLNALRGKYTDALISLDSASSQLESMKNTNSFEYFYQKSMINRYYGITYQKMDRLEKCQDYYYQNVVLLDSLIKNHSENIELKILLAKNYYNLSVAQSFRQHLDKMLEYNQYAEKIYKEIDDQESLGSIYFNYGNYYYLKQQLDSAVLHYHKTIDHAQKYGQQELIFKSYNNFASIFLANENYELAEKYLVKSVQYLDSFKTTLSDRSFVYLQLGKMYLDQGEYEKAEPYTFKAYEILKEGISLEQLTYAYEDLTALYKGKNDYKTALGFHEKYTQLSDSIMNIETEKSIQNMQAQYDLLAKETENKLLKEQNEKDEALLKIHRKNNVYLGIAIFLLLAILVYGYFINSKYKKLNRKLIRSNQDLEDSNREKDGLMSVVAHDLRSPLNKVRGLVNLIKMTGNLNEEQQDILRVVFKEIDNGNDLIRDLLDLSAYESSESLKIESFDLNNFMQKSTQHYQLIADYKNIRIQSDFSDEIFVATDMELLKRIIDNLISNAVKFSPTKANIFIKTFSKGQKACVAIRDEGPGFSEEDKKQLYKKFQRLSAKPTGGEPSTGLGLAIVNTLAKRINADIKLDTQINRGSEFTICLDSVGAPHYA